MLLFCTLELVALFFLSKFAIKALSELILKITRSRAFTVYFLAILFLPGVIIHELSHLLSAGLLFVPSGELELLPKLEEDGVVLGSVKIGHADPIRRIIIGASPFFAGLFLMISFFYFLSTFELSGVVKIFLSFLITFELSNTMFSSKKDMEGSFIVLLIALFVLVALFFLGVDLKGMLFEITKYLNKQSFLNELFYVLGFAIIVDLLIFLGSRFLNRR